MLNSAMLDLTTALSILIVFTGILTLGIVSRRRGFRDHTVRWLMVYGGLFCVGEFGPVIANAAGWHFWGDALEIRVALYEVLLLALAFVYLTRVFVRASGNGLGWWVWTGIGSALLWGLDTNLLALPDVMWLSNGRYYLPRDGLTLSALVIFWGGMVGGAALVTIRSYRQIHQPLHRNRILYWGLVLTITTAAAVVRLTELRTGPFFLDSLLYLAAILVAGYVVSTHRLFDVRYAMRRIEGYLLAASLMTLIYAGVFTIAWRSFQSLSGYNVLIISTGWALLVTLLIAPLLQWMRRRIDRWITGVAYDPRRTLREYSASISNILDLEELARVMLELISETLSVRRAALFVVRRGTCDEHHIGHSEEDLSSCYYLRGAGGFCREDQSLGRAVCAHEDGSLTTRLETDHNHMLEDQQLQQDMITESPIACPALTLPMGSPLAAFLSQEHTPLTQYEIDLDPRFHSISSQERDWLECLDMDVYVPIYGQGEWIGLLAIGPKSCGDRYFDGELDLLNTLADQTAVALENARLFDDLQLRNQEISRLNEELEAANRELILVGQAKSDFIDIASHELRTPLTQVRGYTDILREALEEETLTPNYGKKLVKGLKEAACRLEEIVDMMFDVAQLDTQTMDLNLTPELVSRIVDAAVEPWRPTLTERNITLSVEGISNLPLIAGDFYRLRQALSHLIQNAIKFTPDGGRIRITGLMRPWTLPQEQAIELVVADTGIGIDPEELERIFEKFYRIGNVLLHSTGKTKFKGAGPGLGLTVARGIIEAHGGRIWAESPGCDEQTCPGSEFHIVLPVHPSRESLSTDRLSVVAPATGVNLAE